MNVQTAATNASLEEALEKADQAFQKGEVSATWALIEPIIPQRSRLQTAGQHHTLNMLQLGCAIYQTGDLAAANQLNATLKVAKGLLPIRYRLAIRQHQYRTAKMLRSHPIAVGDETLQADFKCSAGIYCLWHNRPRAGFRLYASRNKAIMFPKIVPDSLRYAPLPADPAQDVDRIILEQGVGDMMFHLAHIRQQGNHATSTFIGAKHYAALVRDWFPKGQFIYYGNIPEKLRGKPCHCSADFLSRSLSADNAFPLSAPRPYAPTRGPLDRPVIGICWRGGSGQNRREERHIPLHFFLDMLPKHADYIPLQFDMTDAERTMLMQDSRVSIPFMDVTSNPQATSNVIRDLAGVISVDSANWHFAGCSDVPFLAIMNKTSHWFWGGAARADSAYPAATTIAKEQLTRQGIKDWVGQATRSWRDRPKQKLPTPSKLAAPQIATPIKLSFETPVFVVSPPRTRSSLMMGAFAKHGIWTGQTVKATPNNPYGFYENEPLRETYLKGVLKDMDADPLGVSKLPPLFPQPPFPHLAYQLHQAIQRQGYQGGAWGFKDPKLTLVWPMYAKAFPNAHWVVLTRNAGDTIKSICKTTFMQRHSQSTDYWRMFLLAYEDRLEQLIKRVPQASVLDTDRVIQGDYGQCSDIFEQLGIQFSPDIMNGLIDPNLAKRHLTGAQPVANATNQTGTS
ncbi:MAG: sulfotransferase [Planktomarina sp.]